MTYENVRQFENWLIDLPPKPSLHGPTSCRTVAYLRLINLAFVLQHAQKLTLRQVDVFLAAIQFALPARVICLDFRLERCRRESAARWCHFDLSLPHGNQQATSSKVAQTAAPDLATFVLLSLKRLQNITTLRKIL